MEPVEAHARTADWYRTFAEHEARGSSPVYEQWAQGIATDSEVLGLLEDLPWSRRQPNLIFGAARWLGADPGPYADLRGWLLRHWVDVSAVAARRSTQTNEAGRCATLLPLLAQIEGPVALLEAGASAGLCLYPDRYSYRYETRAGTVRLDPADGPSDVVLPCRLRGGAAPTRVPEVVWRAGIDLNPLDVSDDGDLAWLSALVWPEHAARSVRLHAAAGLVAADPPLMITGDISTALHEAASRAPGGVRLVVFHSAVLAYLEPDLRREFVSAVRDLDATWISNEGWNVLPEVIAGLPARSAPDRRFVLAQDGVPRALTDPHGATYDALDRPGGSR